MLPCCRSWALALYLVLSYVSVLMDVAFLVITDHGLLVGLLCMAQALLKLANQFPAHRLHALLPASRAVRIDPRQLHAMLGESMAKLLSEKLPAAAEKAAVPKADVPPRNAPSSGYGSATAASKVWEDV